LKALNNHGKMVENEINQKNLVLKITLKNLIIKSGKQNLINEKPINSQILVKLYKFDYVFLVRSCYQH
jgi:hypothetical protein